MPELVGRDDASQDAGLCRHFCGGLQVCLRRIWGDVHLVYPHHKIVQMPSWQACAQANVVSKQAAISSLRKTFHGLKLPSACCTCCTSSSVTMCIHCPTPCPSTMFLNTDLTALLSLPPARRVQFLWQHGTCHIGPHLDHASCTSMPLAHPSHIVQQSVLPKRLPFIHVASALTALPSLPPAYRVPPLWQHGGAHHHRPQ